MLLVPAQTHALEIGARLPTRYGEVIVVKNDGGVKHWTTYFPYGSICHTDLDLKTWLIVKRIVGEQTLLVVDFGVESMRISLSENLARLTVGLFLYRLLTLGWQRWLVG